jgi:hypothetical protein
MTKSTKVQKQKWTPNKWRMLYEWMTVHEEIGTPWEEREKLWGQTDHTITPWSVQPLEMGLEAPVFEGRQQVIIES